jgi:AraC family transcriptional regulator
VVEYIEANLTRPIYLEDLGKVAGVSRMHFAIQFRAATGFSPHQYLLNRKIACGQRLLLNPLISIVDASMLSGFSSQAHFTLVFKKRVGETPGRWRARMQATSCLVRVPFKSNYDYAPRMSNKILPPFMAAATAALISESGKAD